MRYNSQQQGNMSLTVNMGLLISDSSAALKIRNPCSPDLGW